MHLCPVPATHSLQDDPEDFLGRLDAEWASSGDGRCGAGQRHRPALKEPPSICGGAVAVRACGMESSKSGSGHMESSESGSGHMESSESGSGQMESRESGSGHMESRESGSGHGHPQLGGSPLCRLSVGLCTLGL